MHKLIISALLLFTLLASKAQIPPAWFSNINVENGLSQSSVYSIFQDQRGYMWFGTGYGISRYDGAETKSYFPSYKNPNQSITSLTIRGKLIEDRKHNIWFANESGIFCYQPGKDSVELITNFANQAHQSMWPGAIFLSTKGTLWVFNYSKGVITYNIHSKQKKYYAFDLPKSEVSTTVQRPIFVAQNQRYLWFSRYKLDGLFRYDTKKHQTKQLFKGKEYLHLSFQSNKIFLADRQKVDIYNQQFQLEKSIKLPKFTKQNSVINALLVDRHNRIWIAIYQEGLFCYTPETNSFTIYKKNNRELGSLASNLCTSLYLDEQNNLWVGTDGGGVCKLDLKSPLFASFPNRNSTNIPSSSDYFIKCFYQDAKQNTWFGTANNGIGIYNTLNKTIHFVTHNEQKIPITNIGALYKDNQNRLWVGTADAIGIYDSLRNQVNEIEIANFQRENAISGNFVNKFIELKNGQLLAATKLGLMSISPINNSNFQGKFLKQHRSLSNTITDIVRFQSNKIIFSTVSEGLFLFDLAKGFTKPEKQYLIKNKINSIHIDQSQPDIIWLGTDNGLIQLNVINQEKEVFNKKDGMNNSYIYGILNDDYGNLWLSTNGGLSCFNKSKQDFVNFTYDNGLQSNEFNARAYYKSAEGNLLFGGINGFNWFNPKQVFQQRQQSTPKTVINAIIVNENEQINIPTKTIRLPYWKNQLNIQLAVLDYTQPDANQIQYQFVGIDKSVSTSKFKNIRYPNLQPGTYTLNYWGINSYQQKSKLNSLKIIITPPYWQTWWFYLLVSSMLIIGIVSITKRYSNQKLKKRIAHLEQEKLLEQERQRIAREIHDDIAAGLTRINMMSRKACKNPTNDGIEELEKIAETSTELSSSMNDIIWNLKTPLDFPDFIQHTKQMIEKMLVNSEICYHLEIPSALEKCVSLTPEKQQNLIFATQEILHNAIKYSHANNLWIRVSSDQHCFQISIKDDGQGCDFEKIKLGNGLKNIHYRMKQIGGELSYSSTIGKGCEFNYGIVTSS